MRTARVITDMAVLFVSQIKQLVRHVFSKVGGRNALNILKILT